MDASRLTDPPTRHRAPDADAAETTGGHGSGILGKVEVGEKNCSRSARRRRAITRPSGHTRRTPPRERRTVLLANTVAQCNEVTILKRRDLHLPFRTGRRATRRRCRPAARPPDPPRRGRACACTAECRVCSRWRRRPSPHAVRYTGAPVSPGEHHPAHGSRESVMRTMRVRPRRAVGIDDGRSVIGTLASTLEQVEDDDDTEFACFAGERVGGRAGMFSASLRADSVRRALRVDLLEGQLRQRSRARRAAPPRRRQQARGRSSRPCLGSPVAGSARCASISYQFQPSASAEAESPGLRLIAFHPIPHPARAW